MIEDDYLTTLAMRAELHKKTLENTRDYLIKHKVTDARTIQNCLVIGQIWAADMIGKPLNVHDLMLYLGNADAPIADHNEMILDEQLKNKPLVEVLDMTVEQKGKLF